MANDVTFTTTVATAPAGTKVATYEDDTNGQIQRVVVAGPDEWQANDNQSTAQTNTALQAAPGAGVSLYVTDFIFSTDTAMNVKLVEDTGGTPATIFGPHYFPANSGHHFKFQNPLKVTAATNLGYTSSDAGNHTVDVLGFQA